MNKAITSAQCRAARALLGWDRVALARASGVSTRAIADFESGARQPQFATTIAIRLGLESAGVAFIDDGQGVRLRQ
jgi:transcriptional regulator with XRE-family HTH domain